MLSGIRHWEIMETKNVSSENTRTVLTVKFFEGVAWLNRPRAPSRNQIFWLEVTHALVQAEGHYTLDLYKRVMTAFINRYDLLACTPEQALKALESDPHYEKIETVFALEAMFSRKDSVVTSEQHLEYFAALNVIVPRRISSC